MTFTRSDQVPETDGRARGGGYRRDLFKFIDIIAITPTGILAVQSTSHAKLAPHVRKIRHDPDIRANVIAWLEANADFALYGWRQEGKRWKVEVRRITLATLHESRSERAAWQVEFAPAGTQLDLL